MINHNGMFIGEIRNIMDPYKSGRYQVRVYGHHGDENQVKDEHLPWAQGMHHIGSAATSKIGIIPTGPIVGSRCFGFFLDEAKQYPVILGTFPRGAKLSDSDPDVGSDGLDPESNGIDTPVVGGKVNNS